MKPSLLIMDDEMGICVSLSLALGSEYNVRYETDPRKGLARIHEESFDVVLLDLVIGDYDGLDFLREAKMTDVNPAVIVMTAYGSIRSSVSAMKLGAFTYLSKPLDLEELQIYIRQALEFRALTRRVTYLSDGLKIRYGYGNLIGNSPGMQHIYQMIEKLKDLDASVLVSGESGTGKELVAAAIHYNGKRRDEPFVSVNCAGIPDGLLEDAFFGHKRGSFTGAVSTTIGKLESAGGGTVFLDEIGDMPLNLQGKLLRALQEKAFTPIGSNDLRHFDARIIAATNRDLSQMVQAGTFRRDLYYRINVIEIQIPPLRGRKEDIPLLTQFFIKLNNEQQNKSIQGLTPEAEAALLAQDYPGNVRELANILEYACIFATGDWIQRSNLPGGMPHSSEAGIPQPEVMTLRKLEQWAIESAFARHGGKRKTIAAELGISERTLWTKLQEYGMQ